MSIAPLRAQVPVAELKTRLAELERTMPDGVLLVLGAQEPEADYLTLVQTPEFWYFTGVREPGAALLVTKHGSDATATLFVPPAHTIRGGFPIHGPGPAVIARQTGIAARPSGELRGTLDSALVGAARLLVAGGSEGAPVISEIRQAFPSVEMSDYASAIGRIRARKSPAELALIRKAAEITVMAQREAMQLVAPGLNEFEVQALIEYTFRRNGADRPSFASIVGSGPNSTDLHYSVNDRFMTAGDVVVMDIGASYRGYAADVTRTLPVSGTFTPEQRAIYGIVRNAQRAAEKQATLGAPARPMEDSARAELTRGLVSLGLIEGAGATYDGGDSFCPRVSADAGCPQWYLYYYHSIGHGIGLEVHDPDQYYFPPGRIAPGSAFTIEPGLYVRDSLAADLSDTPRNRAMLAKIGPALARFRNIGIRIEDDYVATDRGVEWVSRAPREIDEVEALMKQHAASPAPRKPDVVEWYRATLPVSAPR